MMDFPLTLISFLERAGKLFPTVEVISRRPQGNCLRSNYGDFYRRTRALAEALQKIGLNKGDRIATLCWNHTPHLEAYFGIPAAGGVVHTLNLRLHPDEIAFIANDAEDRFLIVDDVLLPLLGKFRSRVNFERVFVVPFGDCPSDTAFENYEDLLKLATGDFEYAQLNENDAAAMCYTSGTTGCPKGVLYSHRALVLHSLAAALPDTFNCKQADVLMPVVPMFHANAWGFPFVGAMLGAKQVFPGPKLDPQSLLELMSSEQVTCSAGVPTVWMAFIDLLEQDPSRWKLNPELRLYVGGAAVPESLLRRFDRLGIPLSHSWGMTEISPVGSAGEMKRHLKETLSDDDLYALRTKQGLPIPFVETRAVNEQGEIPWDGETMGELEVRGPFVASGYHKGLQPEKWTADGWFKTGDVTTIDSEGYLKLVDRTKDLIKSGGEWISSVDLESALMCHPAVQEAAVIAVSHPKWLERPLAAVVLRPNMEVSKEELCAWLANKFSKWQLPDAIVFVDQIPRTATGKFLKSKLREKFADWQW
jgi:fatty-acyl-CoA synthase